MGTSCSILRRCCARRRQAVSGDLEQPAEIGNRLQVVLTGNELEQPVLWTGHLSGSRLQTVAFSVRVLPRGVPRDTDLVKATPSGQDCAICLSTITEECVRTGCGHYFHDECMEQYLAVHRKQRLLEEPRCPVCRTSLHVPAPVEATASSGRRIKVTEVPSVGALCHFDRSYTFQSLGDFVRPGMLYVLTSNEDRKTPASKVMWTLATGRNIVVHLNFRSDEHAIRAGSWLRSQGWNRNLSMRSTVSTGIPNGPYAGPVFTQSFAPGKIQLMGSNTWEGVYFVFIELLEMPEVVAEAEAAQADTVPAELVQAEPVREDSTGTHQEETHPQVDASHSPSHASEATSPNSPVQNEQADLHISTLSDLVPPEEASILTIHAATLGTPAWASADAQERSD